MRSAQALEDPQDCMPVYKCGMRVCNHRQALNCELAMKAAPFGYHRVSSVGQAVEYLAAYEGTARGLAGGQSLAPMLNMRLLMPDALIDINGIEELADVRETGDTKVLAALVRHATVEVSP